MIEDIQLEKIEKISNIKSTWGNYISEYDWTWTDRPLVIPLANSKSAAAVLTRDWAIAKKLKELGVKRVLDIGSDTGHFIAVLTYFGIEAVGIDTTKECCDEINKKGINTCYRLGIEDLIKKPLEGYDCITCMNITHAKWENEDLKSDFVKWVGNNTEYAILSDFTNQEKKWTNLTRVHSFNFLPFNYSPLVERIFRYLGLEKIVTYSCIQKLYRSKK